MTYDVRVENLPSRPFAAVQRVAKPNELSRVVPKACGAAWTALKKFPNAKPGRHVAVYLDGQITMQIGVEVDGPFAGDAELFPSATPGGRIAWTRHIGSYAGLRDAHAAIRRSCKEQGHALAGPNWEIYGHWTDDESKLYTDVFYLLA